MNDKKQTRGEKKHTHAHKSHAYMLFSQGAPVTDGSAPGSTCGIYKHLKPKVKNSDLHKV